MLEAFVFPVAPVIGAVLFFFAWKLQRPKLAGTARAAYTGKGDLPELERELSRMEFRP